jgi:hypothetical protein
MADDVWFERLAEGTGEGMPERAPARLKSKVYSALVSRMSGSGQLLDLAETKRAGGHLCVFEDVLTRLPLGNEMLSKNPCRVCHARVLGERMEHAPIFWPGCPYSEFHNG